ncbi:LOW QUALITY PROTEIN: hypothetical protein ACHAWF_015742 [Thalassiosira exigua]
MHRLCRTNVQPHKHMLDNEISEAMDPLIHDRYNMTLELVPPGCHRRNAAKSHFLSILAGVADDFPLQLWDRFLPQAKTTVNLLWQSNATPTVSAYAHLNGPFDYNKMPLAPMGCNVQVHEKTNNWAFHSVDGWYLGTSPEHYRTHKCHIKITRSDRFSDTVHFHHRDITNPTLTPANNLMKAIADCAKIIRGSGADHTSSRLRGLQQLLNDAATTVSNNASRLNWSVEPSQPPSNGVPSTQIVPHHVARVDEPTACTEGPITHSMNRQSTDAPSTSADSTPTPRVPTRLPPAPPRQQCRPQHQTPPAQR